MKKILKKFTEVYQSSKERKSNIFFRDSYRYFRMIVRNKKHTIITDEDY
jgi:hypothetical protein